MKTVFSSKSEVAHLWANQQQDYARQNGGSLYFSRETIYSYGSHFPIAKHVESSTGERAILFTERTYSNTTAKHISVVSSACSNDRRIYCYSPEATHTKNFEEWIGQAEWFHKKLARARKPEKYISELNEIKARAERYAEFFGIEVPEMLAKAVDTDSIDKLVEYGEEKLKIIEAARIQREKETAARKKKEAKEFKERVVKWLNFETSYLYGRLNDVTSSGSMWRNSDSKPLNR